MDVILLEKINQLGELGDCVSVKAGYGRNYLIPYGKALSTTPENLEEFERRRADLEHAQASALVAAQTRAEVLDATTIQLERMASDEGRLFGSVTAANIVEAVAEIGLELAKSELRLPNGPIRSLGEFKVTAHLHAQVNASITVIVCAQET